MATIVIKYDGDDITDKVVFSRTNFSSVADGNVGQCTVTIDDRGQSFSTTYFQGMPDGYFSPGKTLELLVDGTRVWDGWVFTVARTWPLEADDTSTSSETPRFWELGGQDRNLLFHKRLIFRQNDPSDNGGLPFYPEDTPDKTVINEYMNKFVDLSGDGIDLVSGVEQIASANPFEEGTFAFVSAPLGVLFEDISKMTGGVYFIGPDRVLYYVDDRTVTAPFVLSDTPTGSEVGYRDLDAAQDFTHAANEALVWGAGLGSATPVFAKYTDATSVTNHDLWQWGDQFMGAYKQQTVNRRARTYVEGSPSHRRGHNEPVPVVRCVIHTPGLYAGLVADFQANVFGYQEDLPIREVSITFPTPTDVRYELELTLKVDSPFSAPDPYPPLPPWQIGPLPDWWPTTVDPSGPSTLIDHYDTDIVDNALQTPGPEITGAPWPGGNDYKKTTKVLLDMVTEDSYAASKFNLEYRMRVNDAEISIIDWDGLNGLTEVWEDQPWSGFSTRWWSGQVNPDNPDLLFKWRWNGDTGLDSALMRLQVTVASIPDDEDLQDVWISEVEVRIEEDGYSLFNNISNWLFGDKTWPDTFAGSDDEFMYPIWTFANKTAPFWEVNTWYWTRLQLAAPLRQWGYPYTSAPSSSMDDVVETMPEFRVRSWKDGDPEPTEGESDSFQWEWTGYVSGSPPVPTTTLVATAPDGWDMRLPQAWLRNTDDDRGDGTGYATGLWKNDLELLSANQPSAERFEIDAIYAGGTSEGGGGVGPIASGIPTYDGAGLESETSLYVTPYPYQAGSLIVFREGIKLRSGVDYIETDPKAGEFRILGTTDASGGITVKYIRGGTDPTTSGGNVYRPSGQIAYGWGTPLDAYNALFAAGATALDRHTVGAHTTFVGSPKNTPPNVRGNQSNQSDFGDITDIAAAWSAGWGETMAFVGDQTFADFWGRVAASRGGILMGTYSGLPASKRFSEGFSGQHALFINERFSNGNFLGYDPLYPYPVIYTATELQSFAVGFSTPGAVRAGFTQVTS